MTLEQLAKKYNIEVSELENILKQISKTPKVTGADFRHYYGNKIRLGIMSDTHIGSKEFDDEFFKYMCAMFDKQKVDGVYHAGDILEGMSGRDGHIYELNEIGFNNQINKAEKLFKRIKSPIYGINGNHDDWYAGKNNGGVDVGIELAKRVKNYHHLGSMEADIDLGHKVKLKLFHPNDGTAYATSYKLQKLIESLSGGDKPNILIEGHYHKALYMFNRNVHGFEAGTLAGQTKFMRGKKIAANKGFWILDVSIGKEGIGKIVPTFYPGYK